MLRLYHVTTPEHYTRITDAGFLDPEKAVGKRKCVYLVRQEGLEWAAVHCLTRWSVQRVFILRVMMPCAARIKAAGTPAKAGFWYYEKRIPVRLITRFGSYYAPTEHHPLAAWDTFNFLRRDTKEIEAIKALFDADYIPF